MKTKLLQMPAAKTAEAFSITVLTVNPSSLSVAKHQLGSFRPVMAVEGSFCPIMV
jgi:hypothetical protein